MNADGRAELEAILTTTNPGVYNGPLHERIARYCWKHHAENFVMCEEPPCVFLKKVALAAGWNVDTNGVIPQ